MAPDLVYQLYGVSALLKTLCCPGEQQKYLLHLVSIMQRCLMDFSVAIAPYNHTVQAWVYIWYNEKGKLQCINHIAPGTQDTVKRRFYFSKKAVRLTCPFFA